jgi:type III secretion protein N (ATPase)
VTGPPAGPLRAGAPARPRLADPAALDRIAPLALCGRLTRISGLALEAALGGVRQGEVVEIGAAPPLLAEVVGLREERAVLLPLGEPGGIGLDAEVRPSGAPLEVRAGEGLLGRVLDGLGRPIDGRPAPEGLVAWPVDRSPPPALSRERVRAAMPLGVRALDGFLTLGRGQRLGLFAGAGVGKSSLLGRIARDAAADAVVVCLVGERGREVREFVEDALGPAGLARSVVVAATSDAPALVRLRAPQVATALAEWLAEGGRDVLFLCDSVTRFARAQREVGLAAGEPPARQGYPASVFQALPRLLERTGGRARGCVTAVYTVLVAGGDQEEPIADEVRGLLDGHVILDRRLAERGHFPAVDVLASVSRVMGSVAAPAHAVAAARVRALLAAWERQRDLVLLGAYRAGSDPEVDRAIERWPAIEAFLRQGSEEREPFERTVERLQELAA